jgi:hypothetical protein
MASLGQIKENQNCWRVRFSLRKKRLSITLSGIPEYAAKTWTEHVGHLVLCAESHQPPAKGTIEWIASLSPTMRKKLENCGLVEVDKTKQVEEKQVMIAPV